MVRDAKLSESKGFIVLMDTIIVGNAESILKKLPRGQVQACVTSPPYWGLRDYELVQQIGSEEKLSTYLRRLSRIFGLLKNVVKDDGVLWLNVGDTYTSGNRGWRATDKKNAARGRNWRPDNPPGMKNKELVGLPWELARAARRQGWYVRSEVIWHKTNGQPESAKDRPTRAHEQLFLLSNSERYYYDGQAIAEPSNGDNATKNRRSVWSLPTKPFNGNHFAVFPTELVHSCILASTRPGDLVLDPFFGTGTVGLVCQELGRQFLGIELSHEFAEIARTRLNLSTKSVLLPREIKTRFEAGLAPSVKNS